ncbi:zinc finger protein 830 [Pyrus ussuriensis x Pyrus communis]|uniref:Zinc finger protein 830 n=1 Tax=Pyrus ussuriensis x Pyrus communis TaxID=2448454 RepID=A0A5N5F0L3_9ROSA|nr:zinc finger protein 830 [Pyrus ussuriensis x Pyrus communis]
MDAKARNKALFPAKLNAQKKDKRMDSPLVRYNESDQPVCRVCDNTLKSESQMRIKHRALSNFKATAAGLNRVNNAKAEARPELPKSKPEHSVELHIPGPERSTQLPREQLSSELPPDFFDNHDAKKQNTGREKVQTITIEPGRDLTQTSSQIASSEAKQIKGALPEGFFDNKEADLSARGIKPVKQDVKEYRDLKKLMGLFHIDAAETIKEAESVDQRAYSEKVELLKKKKLELKGAAKRRRVSEVLKKEASHNESSSDSETDENFAVDWSAQHL